MRVRTFTVGSLVEPPMHMMYAPVAVGSDFLEQARGGIEVREGAIHAGVHDLGRVALPTMVDGNEVAAQGIVVWVRSILHHGSRQGHHVIAILSRDVAGACAGTRAVVRHVAVVAGLASLRGVGCLCPTRRICRWCHFWRGRRKRKWQQRHNRVENEVHLDSNYGKLEVNEARCSPFL